MSTDVAFRQEERHWQFHTSFCATLLHLWYCVLQQVLLISPPSFQRALLAGPLLISSSLPISMVRLTSMEQPHSPAPDCTWVQIKNEEKLAIYYGLWALHTTVKGWCLTLTMILHLCTGVHLQVHSGLMHSSSRVKEITSKQHSRSPFIYSFILPLRCLISTISVLLVVGIPLPCCNLCGSQQWNST